MFIEKRIWPHFFIVGAPKAGTTSLYHYLKNVPGIFVSPTKEPHFFIAETALKTRIIRVESEDEYLQLFSNASPDDILGEASTAYLRAPEAPGLIAAKSPQAKIIILLREPGERAFSHFLMHSASGEFSASFSQGLKNYSGDDEMYNSFRHNVINPGFYTEEVKRYLDAFGTENVKVFLFDEFASNPESIVTETLRFLGIDAVPSIDVEKSHNYYRESKGGWARALLRRKYLLKWLKPIVPPQLKWKLIRTFLQKDSEKPQLASKDRFFLTSIFQQDVLKLRCLLEKPELWSEHYPTD